MDRHRDGCGDSGRLGLCDERAFLIDRNTRRAPKGTLPFYRVTAKHLWPGTSLA
jgi:hypothetical protein